MTRVLFDHLDPEDGMTKCSETQANKYNMLGNSQKPEEIIQTMARA
jgi:hypothetical protein